MATEILLNIHLAELREKVKKNAGGDGTGAGHYLCADDRL